MENNLLLRFPDQSESFTYGVEFGKLLEKMERGDCKVENNGFPVRVENLNLLKEACLQNGYIVLHGEPYLEGWVDFIGIKSSSSTN